MAKSYSEKLLDPRWQKRRLDIFNRDNWTCQSCNDISTTLHIHHLKYFPGKDPWEYEDCFLVTYCEKCHNTEHDIGAELHENLIHLVQENKIFIKPTAQISILIEKWEPFYAELKKFLNSSMINYLQSKSNVERMVQP